VELCKLPQNQLFDLCSCLKIKVDSAEIPTMPAQQHLSRYARGLLIIFTMAAKPLVGDGMVEKIRV